MDPAEQSSSARPEKRTNVSAGGFAGYQPLLCRTDSSLKLKQKAEDKGSDSARNSGRESESSGTPPSPDADTAAMEPHN